MAASTVIGALGQGRFSRPIVPPYLDDHDGGDDDAYVDMLSEEECRQVRAVLYQLKGHWARFDSKGGNRLGFPSYKIKDMKLVPVGRAIYGFQARRFNALFRRHLGWLYDRVANRLAEVLGAPTRYPDKLALPGFHIFLSPLENMYVHHDQQHKNVSWAGLSNLDLSDTLSFTLPIALPASGGGLNLWNLYADEFMQVPPAERQGFVAQRRRTFVPYKVGKAVCHSGQRVHQMAASADFRPGDERITLQGHGVMSDGTWLLYW